MHRNKYLSESALKSANEKNSGTLSCHTCILWWGNSRTFPTVGFDHWKHGRLVVGRSVVRLSSGVEGRRSSTLEVGDENGMLSGEKGSAVKNRFRSLELGFQTPERRKRAV
ncbi:hypothetical protein AVEN_48236-1 [Araneus ventricosus]|uniref:Uncharacterized protein n=1 Tax=Araneus ventricosus TaxID=182803 RepID=A0A4Y2V4T1_ARAVE|nr:hypothetical protein AVEN_48236-1 [Araneus ventricosus]